ncbi:MAG: hypothetical protein L0Z62_44745 [Gemmataceae bacterium]|nr:hypothetical protein [Gemmataceae bacterium]
MIPTPTAIGLTLGDSVIVEEGTRKVSLIGTFRRVTISEFPAVLAPFVVYTALTGGAGSGRLELTLTRLETGEELFTYNRPITLPDPLREVRVVCRVLGCEIPAEGAYEFVLLVDGEWIARRRCLVFQSGGSP